MESEDPTILRRREKTAERVKRYYERRRAAVNNTTLATTAQIEQSDKLITLPTVEEEEAATTLLALGVRASPTLGLPQDRLDAQLQQSAVHVNEHDLLYSKATPNDDRAKKSLNTGFFRQFHAKKPEIPESSSARSSNTHVADAVQSARATTPKNVSVITSESTPDISAHLLELNDDNAIVYTGDPSHATVNAPLRLESVQQPADASERSANASSNSHGQAQPTGLSIQGSEDLLGLNEESSDEDCHTSPEREPRASLIVVRETDDEREDNECEQSCEYTAEKLFAQLQGGHHGCSPEQHAEQLQEHLAHEGNNHYGLGEVFHDRDFISVLGEEEIVNAAYLEQQAAPTTAQWQAMFCGVPTHGRQRMSKNVCLHKERTHPVEPGVAFDVDSFLGFSSSLAVAKQGFWYQPAPQTQQNIQTDVHLEMHASTYDDGTTQASKKMLRDVPHFLLGRVYGASNVTIHVLFPHLPLTAGRDHFVSMTQQQLAPVWSTINQSNLNHA